MNFLGSNIQAQGDIKKEILSQTGKTAAALTMFNKAWRLIVYN